MRQGESPQLRVPRVASWVITTILLGIVALYISPLSSMPPSKRRRQLADLAEAKRQKRKQANDVQQLQAGSVHVDPTPESFLEPSFDPENMSDSSDDSEVEITDCEEPEDDNQFSKSAFDLLENSFTSGKDTKFNYQRTCQPSRRTTQRQKEKQQKLVKAAEGCQTLTSMFASQSTQTVPPSTEGSMNIETKSLDSSIKTLERKLTSKKVSLNGQNRMRHEAVLRFLHLQTTCTSKKTREELALNIANSYSRGTYFARKLISWERTWFASQTIDEGKKGCYQKTSSWFNDEGVLLAVREWLSGANESMENIRGM